MRILILEDSEHNLASAREFAEKVKGEHEVRVSNMPVMYTGSDIGKYNLILTDLFMPRAPKEGEEIMPLGIFIALKALALGVPVGIVTDAEGHGDDLHTRLLDSFFHGKGNERFQVFFVSREPKSQYYIPIKGIATDGRNIKDWEACFQKMTQQCASA